MGTKTFNYTGSGQPWVVPTGVTFIDFDLKGAGGGSSPSGKGGRVTGRLATTLGETLHFYIGGHGEGIVTPGVGGLGGWNGGGKGGDAGTGLGNTQAGTGGGGSTDIRQGGTALANRQVVAGGGAGRGGRNPANPFRYGGYGGGLNGQDGQDGAAPTWSATGYGRRGTQTGGGQGGDAFGVATFPGQAGVAGQGGYGGYHTGSFGCGGGGGGGGWFGGGGGGAVNSTINGSGGSGGGGGSGYRSGSNVSNDASYPGGGMDFNQDGVAVITWNEPPLAPGTLSPRNNVVVNLAQVQRFSWLFSDPDLDDSQSSYQIRYRVSGTLPWTTMSQVESVAQFRDFAANFWTVGNWEWQARTADAQGLWGPWSSSEFFEAIEPPPGPTIVHPANEATIATEESYIEWSTSEQGAYQVRKLGDDAGQPDSGTILFDSGEIVSSFTRSHNLTFPVNDRNEHLQVRVRKQGLWGPYSSVRILVSYTPPTQPTLMVIPESNEGRIRLQITNPEPLTPLVIYNRIERRQSGEAEWILLHEGVSPNSILNDYTVASGIEYEYRVTAFADNGTATVSESGSGILVLRFMWLHKALDPAGTIQQFIYNNEGGKETWEPDVTFTHYAGRRLPVAEFGEFESEQVSVKIELDTPEDIDYMRRAARSKDIYCYRDASGRKLYGIIPHQILSSRFYGGSVDFELIAIAYEEGFSDAGS